MIFADFSTNCHKISVMGDYPEIFIENIVYYVKCSDVTGNRFKWEIGENKVI